MKTTNNAQKTENRNLGNSMFRNFIAAGLVLFTLTVSANKSEIQLQENTSTLNNELLASASITTIASRTFFIELSKENKLEIENWMSDDKIFGNNVFTDQLSQEETLEIESWMIDSSYFGIPEVSIESESTLKVEDWMITHSVWK